MEAPAFEILKHLFRVADYVVDYIVNHRTCNIIQKLLQDAPILGSLSHLLIDVGAIDAEVEIGPPKINANHATGNTKVFNRSRPSNC